MGHCLPPDGQRRQREPVFKMSSKLVLNIYLSGSRLTKLGHRSGCRKSIPVYTNSDERTTNDSVYIITVIYN